MMIGVYLPIFVSYWLNSKLITCPAWVTTDTIPHHCWEIAKVIPMINAFPP